MLSGVIFVAIQNPDLEAKVPDLEMQRSNGLSIDIGTSHRKTVRSLVEIV